MLSVLISKRKMKTDTDHLKITFCLKYALFRLKVITLLSSKILTSNEKFIQSKTLSSDF